MSDEDDDDDFLSSPPLRDDKVYQPPTEITLVVKDGTLYFPKTVVSGLGYKGPILLHRYPDGDCDTVSWPNPNLKHLRSELFDAVETGDISEKTIVRLPNGEVFPIYVPFDGKTLRSWPK